MSAISGGLGVHRANPLLVTAYLTHSSSGPEWPLFRPARNNRTGDLKKAITRDATPGPAESIRGSLRQSRRSGGLPGLRGVGMRRPIPDIGPPTGVYFGPKEGERVRKVGRTTGLTEGRIRDIDFLFRLKYELSPGRKRKVSFERQVLCARFARHGDSGALVVSSCGFAVGVILGGTPKPSAFSIIGPILELLDFDVITE